jgi:hypothetical protein
MHPLGNLELSQEQPATWTEHSLHHHISTAVRPWRWGTFSPGQAVSLGVILEMRRLRDASPAGAIRSIGWP